MIDAPYNPFAEALFDNTRCFLSGDYIDPESVRWVYAFPEWILDRYQLRDNYILMLGGTRLQYKDLKMPASERVVEAINRLDEESRNAFEGGYEELVKLSDLTIFQVMARMFYGVLYHDLKQGMVESEEKRELFKVNPALVQKFKNLHLMLQSLYRQIEFDGFIPWTIQRYKVDISKDIFNYKDEVQHLNFCLSLNYLGIAACLQDNGEVGLREKEIIRKIGNNTLHPAQFEELYGRFVYANYLLSDTEDYEIRYTDEKVTLRLPNNPYNGKPKFAPWKDDIFAQVLTNMWNPWGIPLEIVDRYPHPPLSYLINERTDEFIPHEQIPLDR